MKKKLSTKTSSSKSTRRTTRKVTSGGQTIVFHRIVIVSAVLALFVVGAITLNRHDVMKSVAGTSIMRGAFAEATVKVPNDLQNAVSYTIYYKQADEKEFTNSVQNVSPTVGSYTISHLKKGASYEYRFAAVDASGKEYMYSEIIPLTDLRSM